MEKWKKEFDKLAPATLIVDGLECDLKPVILPIKKFIKDLLKQQKKEILSFMKYGGDFEDD